MEKKRLQHVPKNASKCDTIALGSVVIRIKHGGFEVFCDNVSEAAELLRQLGEQDATGKTPWNGGRFTSFIEGLGESQRDVLRILLLTRTVKDVDLRQRLGITSNQQLAGILSGISKQAAARDIPARAVFRINNEYESGERTKYFVVAPEFEKIASDSNWPDAEAEPEPDLETQPVAPPASPIRFGRQRFERKE